MKKSRPSIHFHPRCIECHTIFKPDQFLYVCPKCSGLLSIERDEDWIDKKVGKGKQARDYFDEIRFGKQRSQYPNDSGVFMWRDHILPGFPISSVTSLREGFTDLFEIPDWLKKEVGLNKLYIKMEGQLPSESFKDRGMSVAISEALRLQQAYPALGIKYVACASTGDTSAAAAIYSAYVKDKLGCIVFLPHEKISPSQLFQAMAHGAKVLAIKHKDGFDGCMKLIQEFTALHPEIVLVNSKNAYRLVGQETIALEMCQDLNWKAPDWIAVPAGNGGNLTALLTSLLRMKKRGMIQKLPGIIVGQTEAANTFVRWSKSNFTKYEPGVFKDTIASAMNIQSPVSFPRILKMYPEFEIKFFDVSDQHTHTTRALFMSAGANICPQTAVALDAVLQARDKKIVTEKDVVVTIGTASGIKFAESGIEFHMNKNIHKGNKLANAPKVIEGSILKIEKALFSK